MEVYRAKVPNIVRCAQANLPRPPIRVRGCSDEMKELRRAIEVAVLTPLMAPANERLLASLWDLNLRAEYSA